MGIFKLAGMTMGSLLRKAPTRKYPYEVREPFQRTRGLVEMTDIKACIFCGLCSRKCPAHCIQVDKDGQTWTYEPIKCISCGSCERACPKKILDMTNKRIAITVKPEPVVVKRPPLTAEEQAELERKEAEKKARIEAARAAKKAKEEAAAAARKEQ